MEGEMLIKKGLIEDVTQAIQNQNYIKSCYFQELKTLPKIDSQDLRTSFYSYTTILTQVSMTALSNDGEVD